MDSYKIIWTTQAKQDLKNVYEYWKKKSVQGAKNVRSDILKSPTTIYYAKQY
jgi:plasmid stabilization system protein ParE